MSDLQSGPAHSASVPVFRIFLSSPGDVTDERNLAIEVVQRSLPAVASFRGHVGFEIVAWDDPEARIPLLANETPQESVNQARLRPALCPITVVILWSRMGTRLPPTMRKPNGEEYLSGTEWEYLDACNSHLKPDILIYRRTEVPKISLDDPQKQEAFDQYDLVKGFFDQLAKERRGVNPYGGPSEFKTLLRQHLEDLIYRRLQSMPAQAKPGLFEPAPARWPGSPYPGLRPFRSNEAAIFFGRGREADALIAAVRDSDPGFVVVVGDSGTGKSSLVYAGVLPRITAGAIHGRKDWVVVDCRPASAGENPLLSLAGALVYRIPEISHRLAIDVAMKLRADPASIREIIETACGGHADGGNFALFIDQFEELFTHSSEDLRTHFVTVLAHAAADPRCRVLSTLRADFLPAASELAPLEPLLRRGTFPLGPPGAASIVDMIREPAAAAGVSLDAEFVDALLADAGNDRGVLPLVAFCLNQLYHSAIPHAKVTAADYEKIGRLRGAVAKHADAVVQEVESRYGAGSTAALSAIFAALVAVDISGTATRQRAPRQPLVQDPNLAALLDALIAGRLLLVSGPAESATVEVAHETLFEGWPALAEWIRGNRADLLSLAELEADARRWGRLDPEKRDDSYLLTGGRLQIAVKLRDQYSAQMSEAARLFLDESQSLQRSQDAATQKMWLYDQLRDASLKKYVKPFLEQRIAEITREIGEERETMRNYEGFKIIRMTETEASGSREISQIQNLLDPHGKWHPESATLFRDLGADMDYTSVWEFPCCGRKVLGSDEPLQFRADGCQMPPPGRK